MLQSMGSQSVGHDQAAEQQQRGREGDSLVAQWQRIHLPVQEMWVPSLGQEDVLGKEMATHSSVLA